MATQILNQSQGLVSNDLVFKFEADFDRKWAQQWMEDNWHTAFYYVAVYLIFIFVGSKAMKDRPRFELRRPLVLWSLGLAAFSILGSYRILPELLAVLREENGFHKSVCNPSWSNEGPEFQLWIFLFVTSKAVELGDTIFIVLRKQPLIFLHYYHHITVLVYSWYTHAEFTAPTRWFVGINFVIHSLMYTYYGLRAMRLRIPKLISVLITSLQIVQMVIGMWVNIYAHQTKGSVISCHVSYLNIYFSLFLYTSYFILFGNFFYKTYLVKNSGIGKSKKLK